MKFYTSDLVDAGLITIGTGLAISDIHQILSIVLLIFNITWILFKFIIKFLKYISNDGKLSEEELDDLMKDVEENLDKKEDDKNE